jgi:esterase/lipase superfamily enzyme
MIYTLDFRMANTGGAVVPGKVIPGAGLGTEFQLRTEPRITFLLHGYNVNRENGRASLHRLAARLSASQNEAVVAVLWPGDHWTRAASYSFEGRDADDSAKALAEYVKTYIPKHTELSFVSHSLGARVAMETVKRLGAYRIRQIALMAPAIDDSSLANPSVYFAAASGADRVAVLASRKDKILKYAYPAGDALQAFVFFWNDVVDLALGYHGPRKSKSYAVPAKVYAEQIPDARGADHGHYIPGDPAYDVPDDPAVANRISAAQFADAILRGEANPKYT